MTSSPESSQWEYVAGRAVDHVLVVRKRNNATAIVTNINVKKNCSLSTTYNGEMTHRKQQK